MEMHDDEMYLLDDITKLMVQNRFDIPLRVGMQKSARSWADLKDFSLTKDNDGDKVNNDSDISDSGG